jgi:predicted nucleotidyltransferase
VKTVGAALTPLLRSDFQGELLALLFLQPTREYSLTQLADAAKVSVSRVHGEVNRLSDSGLVTERRVGYTRLIQANMAHPLARPLTEMLELSYGPGVVVPAVLHGMPGLQRAYVFGSWAARRLGEPGAPPADIDVLLVGEPSRDDMVGAQRKAEEMLHREVNIQRVSVEEWDTPASGFIRTVKDQPLVPLALGTEDAS